MENQAKIDFIKNKIYEKLNKYHSEFGDITYNKLMNVVQNENDIDKLLDINDMDLFIELAKYIRGNTLEVNAPNVDFDNLNSEVEIQLTKKETDRIEQVQKELSSQYDVDDYEIDPDDLSDEEHKELGLDTDEDDSTDPELEDDNEVDPDDLSDEEKRDLGLVDDTPEEDVELEDDNEVDPDDLSDEEKRDLGIDIEDENDGLSASEALEMEDGHADKEQLQQLGLSDSEDDLDDLDGMDVDDLSDEEKRDLGLLDDTSASDLSLIHISEPTRP